MMVGKNTLTSTIENDTYFKIRHEIKMLNTKKSKEEEKEEQRESREGCRREGSLIE